MYLYSPSANISPSWTQKPLLIYLVSNNIPSLRGTYYTSHAPAGPADFRCGSFGSLYNCYQLWEARSIYIYSRDRGLIIVTFKNLVLSSHPHLHPKSIYDFLSPRFLTLLSGNLPLFILQRSYCSLNIFAPTLGDCILCHHTARLNAQPSTVSQKWRIPRARSVPSPLKIDMQEMWCNAKHYWLNWAQLCIDTR